MHGGRPREAQLIPETLQAAWPLRRRTSSVAELFSDADDKLLKTSLHNTNHVLQSFLTDRIEVNYNLRSRTHNKSLITKTTHLTDRDLIVRMLYKDSY